MIERAVAACHRNIYWKSEDMLCCIVGIFDGGRIIELAVSVLAKTALVAVLVGLQLTMIAIEVVLVPCLGCNDTICCTLLLQVGGITERHESRGAVAP